MTVDKGSESEAATASAQYAEYLQNQRRGWKQFVDVQAPYRFNTQRICSGRVLEVGCGLGRNLKALGASAIGVDHNERALELCRAQGFTVYPSSTFGECWKAEGCIPFDSLLFAHVLEHMERSEAASLIEQYSHYLRPGGRLVAITPQERGFASDPTHVAFCDFDALRDVMTAAGFRISSSYSFPFPRFAGPFFKYNEFVVVGTRLK